MQIEQKVEFVQSALLRMARHTYPFIASIVDTGGAASTSKLLGSALRLAGDRRKYLITAAHLAHEVHFGALGITGLRGSAPFRLDLPALLSDSAIDIAAFALPAGYPVRPMDFWPVARVDDDDEKLSTDFLVVHGFPKSRSNFDLSANAQVSSSLPYGAMRREDDLPNDLGPFQFAMDFDPENFRGPDGQAMEWTSPEGLSGSPVWRIGASGARIDEWSPDDSELVGIVTQWRPRERMLVATKAHALLQLLERG